MKTKNIFKALALAMLMPATMLTTACSSDDSIINDEPTATKGFELPVTVNVTRQGDEGTTRATYNESTHKLGFSSGDKLFVSGLDNGFKQFAGILTWQSGGTFSGTITTENTSYTGTADDLFNNANYLQANLLPAGYDSKGFIIVDGSGYQMNISYDWTKAFALTKAEAVEQLSNEYAGSYSSGTGFALAPLGFILNFTITGLPSSTVVAVSFIKGPTTISGNVTTDGSGNATFAMSINATSIGNGALTVGGYNIALPSSTALAKGKIYNITRSAIPPAEGHALSTSVVGEIVGSDGNAYAVVDKGNLPTGVTAVAMVAYKSGSNGLAIALTDETGTMNWATANSTCEGKTAVGGNSWHLPSQPEWKQMFAANGGNEDSYTGLNTTINTAGGTTLQESTIYWSSSGHSPGVDAYGVQLDNDGIARWYTVGENYGQQVRACLAF